MPTEDITVQYNELRNDILFLLELKIAQETLQFDIQALKHRVSELYNGQGLDLCCFWIYGKTLFLSETVDE